MVLKELCSQAQKPPHLTKRPQAAFLIQLLRPTFPQGSLNHHTYYCRGCALHRSFCVSPQFYSKFSQSAMPSDHCSTGCSVKSHPARCGPRARGKSHPLEAGHLDILALSGKQVILSCSSWAFNVGKSLPTCSSSI